MSKESSHKTLTFTLTEAEHENLNQQASQFGLNPQDFIRRIIDHLGTKANELSVHIGTFHHIGPNIGKYGKDKRIHEGREMVCWASNRLGQFIQDTEIAKDCLYDTPYAKDLDKALLQGKLLKHDFMELMSKVCRKDS